MWIGDCFFEDCPASAVNAVNTTGLVVTNNVFLRCGGGVPAQDSCMVRFRRGDGATVVFNTAYGGGFTNDVLNLNSSTHIEAHDNGFRDESDWGSSGGSDDLPALGTPAVSRDGSGTFSVSVAVSSNAPASVVCVDRGVDYEPMAGVDLSGVQPRTIGAHVDIGCCEADPVSAPIAMPVLATRADDSTDPLGFGTDPSDDSPTFEVTIRNAADGVWYTVYAADKVRGPYESVTSVQAESNGLLKLSIPAPDTIPARFVRIGASESPVTGGTEL